uniref:PDZ and LIM domain-containing protein n=1 Tax=Melopsittacus undulatus TaxID=13146 RepID=A0A8V5H6A7_MELUD
MVWVGGSLKRPEEDSEVRRMLQQSREPRAPPQSGSFRLLQEALRDEPGARRLCASGTGGTGTHPAMPALTAAST